MADNSSSSTTVAGFTPVPSPSPAPDESTSLLAKAALRGRPSREAGQVSSPPTYRLWLAEAWLQIKAAVPVILGYALQNSLQAVSVTIVGQQSAEALAVAAFAYMFATATAWLVALGGTTALDTLGAASYGNPTTPSTDLGVLLQRGLVVLTTLYALIALLWAFFAESLFRALGQEEFVCEGAARFLTLLIPGGLGYVWFEAGKKYLQAQGLMRGGTYALLVAAPANALLNYLLVYRAGLGLDGAPLATGLAYWVAVAALAIYTARGRGKECWGGLAPGCALCLRGLWSVARLALLGFVHVGTEWWAFEIVALAAGRLGTVPLAAQSVIMTADQIINTVPFGLGVAASARIGNLLGARQPREARRAAHCAALLSMLLGAGILAVLMGTKDVFGRIFNDDGRVVKLVAQVMPFVALFQIADGLNGSCGGVLRGMGRQWVGALVNLVSYYGGALPMGIYLAFHGWGLGGLWFGNCVALYIVGVLEWVIVGLSKWDEETKRALGRLRAGDFGQLEVADPGEDVGQDSVFSTP
ncbi:mate-domain-containing protein [Xylariomycetidae sp. FL0641]|nr:mate-domain-containing protein [Xylariomycetidae sp. FL0641]